MGYSLIFELTMQRAVGISKEKVFAEHHGDQQGLLQCIISAGAKDVLAIMKVSSTEVL